MSSSPKKFSRSRVAAFESRRASDMSRLIERLDGEPHVSPSMREVPLSANPVAIDFANRVLTGQANLIIFLTGVGFRHFIASVERHVDRDQLLATLSDITTVVRGPKPVAVMKEFGLQPTLRAPEPNTWREILAVLDENVTLANQMIGIQEYGKTNPSLIAGLEARGAQVISLKVYRWDLPEDIRPLEENIRAIAAGQRDVALFTSANQITNLLAAAERLHLTEELRAGLRCCAIGSIGPTTSEALRDEGLSVDFEPAHAKMGTLVNEAAARSRQILQRKKEVMRVLSEPPKNVADPVVPWYNSPFMRACRLEPTDSTPIWLMRQAGRYMPEYRELRSKVSFLELCKNPELCSEVMVTAVNRLGVDAAIIFSDLLPILEPMGLDLEYTSGDGPVIHNPVRESADVDRVAELDEIDSLHFVMETVQQTRSDLPANIPLIGFAGAPFTLASYVIEGGASRHFLHTKTLMYRDGGAWAALMNRLVSATIRYLNAQIQSGAQCVQLFDSWVGCLSPGDYRKYVLPFTKKVVEGLIPGAPVINFATGNPALLPLLSEAGGDVIGVDWRIQLMDAWAVIGHDKAVQGNLDPGTLLSSPFHIEDRATELLDQVNGRPGHIFNLGHGVLPQTPVDNVIALVESVHNYKHR